MDIGTQIAFDPGVFGTDEIIVFDIPTASMSVVASVGDDVPTYGSPGSLTRVEDIVGDIAPVAPPPKYARCAEMLGCRGSVPWGSMIPSHAFERWSRAECERLARALAGCDVAYYMRTDRFCLRALRSLERARVNASRFMSHLNDRTQHDNPIDILEGFAPDADGLARACTYDRNTLTGRPRVVDGPNIMLLKRQFRDIFETSYEGGRIMMLDYVSHEAAIASALAGRPLAGDVYAEIARSVIGNGVTRKCAKDATIATMYGMGPTQLSKRLECSAAEARSFISAIREHFDFSRTVERLESTILEDASISNAYGRRIAVRSLVRGNTFNAYIQSTAADAALLGFDALIRSARERAIEARALFILHDAIILDMSPAALAMGEEFFEPALVVPGIDCKFAMKMSPIA